MRDLLLGVVTAEVPLTPENVRPGWLAMLVVGLLIVATDLPAPVVRQALPPGRRTVAGRKGRRPPS